MSKHGHPPLSVTKIIEHTPTEICYAPKMFSGFRSPCASPQHFAMKLCPIAAKIAGLIGILPCCVLNDFFSHWGMNVCLICVASLSHHTLCMGNLVWFQGVSQDLEIGCPNLPELSKRGVQIVHLQYFYV